MIRTILALLAIGAAAAPAGPARLAPDAVVPWSDDVAGFGGFSGVEVLDGGARFVAVADSGRWASGQMERDPTGRLTGIRLDATGPLLAISGAPVEGRDSDAEDIALDAQGGFYISYEHFHRIRRHDRIDGPAADLAGHPSFPGLQQNSGLEALAIDAEGVLFAIPERSGKLDRPFPVYRLRDGKWDAELSLCREPPFLVTGADWGPDGKLYLLERDFSWLGFRSRVRRFVLGPDGFDGGETLLETGWRDLDNMEGISVWEDERGRLRVTLLSDDNFFALQQTMFAEYLVEQTDGLIAH